MPTKALFHVEPIPRPSTPRCEAIRTERYYSDTLGTDKRCTFKSRYVIDGKYFCSRHAGAVALKKLIEMDSGKCS